MKTKKEIKRMAYYKVDGENRNLVEEDWDFLIILDACRFDFFKELYMKKYKHIGGNLKKAISPVTFTTDWLDKNFKGFYDDIVYISANPYINSKVKGVASHGFEFDAKKHFFKVIDVWDWGWDHKLGTVPPRAVNEALFKAKSDYKNKRFILHYVQPHAPYISKNYIHYLEQYAKARGKAREETRSRIVKRTSQRASQNKKPSFVNIRMSIGRIIEKTFGIQARWMISKLVGISPSSQPDAIGFKEGIKGLRKAYKENLDLVLEYVAKLVESISGKILITADHGEYLGEYGRYGHTLQPRRSPVIEVPWLIIEKEKSKQEEVTDKEINTIKEKVKRLKGSGKI